LTDLKASEDTNEDSGQTVSNKSKIKLKKLCKTILRQVAYLFVCFCLFHKISVADLGYLIQAPSRSLKLKELKTLIEEHSDLVFSEFSSKREALTFLKKKVCFILFS
jgi:hypothetical protein